MASKISEVQSMPFHQLIGAPLLALIQGQTQAAQATAEFIERIGLKTGDDASAGQLRMMSFGYQKPDAEGNIQNFRIEIPLLSLVPIPAIQIKESELDFSIKINDIKVSSSKTSLSSDQDEAGSWLAKEQAEFRASIATGSTNPQSGTNLQMRVKMRVEQADMPTGIAELFRLFEQSVKSSEGLPPTEPETPSSDMPQEDRSPRQESAQPTQGDQPPGQEAEPTQEGQPSSQDDDLPTQEEQTGQQEEQGEENQENQSRSGD